MKILELASYAKINLTLEVFDKRLDGYHEIDSIVQVIDLSDKLYISKEEAGVIDIEVDKPQVPSGPENSVYRACEVFFQAVGISGGAKCRIAKRIPTQAGLGGGSGNAAAALIALNKLYETGLTESELVGLGARVGSDVPLFIVGGTVRMRGRGELVESLPDAPQLHFVIVKPEVDVSTAWAYAELDRQPKRRPVGASDKAERAIRLGDRNSLIRYLWNDFDSVVGDAIPEVRNARCALEEVGAEKSMLCGSGSAVFGVFESAESAKSAATQLRDRYAEVFSATNVAAERLR
jgi:4-diphosphocytidyl-2-C-methyl-D-erythritol kinase